MVIPARCYNGDMAPMDPSEQPEPLNLSIPDMDSRWRIRPYRLLIGLALVAIGLVGSILNGTIGSGQGRGAPTPVIHGPVLTMVQALDGVRARPELPPNVQTAEDVRISISFHNDGPGDRLIAPNEIHLLVDGRSFAPSGVGRHPLRLTRLQAGAFVTGALSFSRTYAPGATIVWTPSWAGGRVLRWHIWQ